MEWYAVPSFATWTGAAFSFFMAYTYPEQPFYLLLVAVWWRLSYNLGLGYLLKQQSSNGYLTSLVTTLRDKPRGSILRQAMSAMLLPSVMSGQDILNDKTIPPSFPAWVGMISFVNFVER